MGEAVTLLPEPRHQTSVVSLIDAHFESRPDAPRPHLGVSGLGHPCDRYLWLSFRWAVRPKFSGRMLRLFDYGSKWEREIVAQLRAIGVDIVKTAGEQARVDFGCHVSGSLDGIALRGVPAAPRSKHVLEFKTHNQKSFDQLKKLGVQKAKPEHYVQMQCYMLGTKIDRALYVALNKNTHELYEERIKLDKAFAQKAVDRAKRIALSDTMPEPISVDPSWYQCKFCPAYAMCHEKQPTQFVNCRTCAMSTAMPESTWHCAKYDAEIPEAHQRKGCECHVLHPDVVPWQRKSNGRADQAVYVIDGFEVTNGEADANVYSSEEILAGPDALADEKVREVRNFFEAKIGKMN